MRVKPAWSQTLENGFYFSTQAINRFELLDFLPGGGSFENDGAFAMRCGGDR